jgi:hypothetical protein
MVKAEFVFMTGGEVEDEVAEAQHSHELAEGRMENSAQVELLTAIREMSRAEARLNAADTAAALTFERAALAALQRAFDRRRYLLRTLPERTRIDLSRRLTGELATARSSTATASTPDKPLLQEARAVLQELRDDEAVTNNRARLAARLLALGPNDEALQKAALQLTAASDDASRHAAVQLSQRAVAALLKEAMGARAPVVIERDPLTGRLVQELSRGGR